MPSRQQLDENVRELRRIGEMTNVYFDVMPKCHYSIYGLHNFGESVPMSGYSNRKRPGSNISFKSGNKTLFQK